MGIRNILLVAVLLFAAGSGRAQNKSLSKVEQTIGLGRLQASLNRPIPLYRTAKDTVAYDTLKFEVVTTGERKGKYGMSTAHPMSLAPMSYYDGDSDKERADNISRGLVYFPPVLVFRVVGVSRNAFEVVVNEQAFETSVIRPDKEHSLYTQGAPYWAMNNSSLPSARGWYLYEPWGKYFGRLMYVDIEESAIYAIPNGNMIEGTDGRTLFKVDFLAGEWLKIQLGTSEDIAEKRKPEGWVRWTDGKNMLVKPIAETYK